MPSSELSWVMAVAARDADQGGEETAESSLEEDESENLTTGSGGVDMVFGVRNAMCIRVK